MDFVRNEGAQGGRHLRRRLTCDNGPVLPTRRARLLIGPGIVPADASMADVSGVRARSSMSMRQSQVVMPYVHINVWIYLVRGRIP